MKHELSELNQYTGLFTAVCALALVFCFHGLGRIERVVMRFWQDYRKVNDLDVREEMESRHD